MKTKVKKQMSNKGKRLGWVSLKDAKQVKLTYDVHGRVISASEIKDWQSKMNVSNSSLLVP